MKKPLEQPGNSQQDRFIDAAREVGADEDPEAFKERLKRLMNAPPPKTVKERKTKKPTK